MIWLGALLLLAGAGNGFAQFELFEERETMFGDSALRSHAAATADLDLDGDLDVVFGTVASDSSCAVYLNRDGRFGAVPDWEPEGPYPSVYDVALGDLNGDGLVDLVCATNAWFPAVAYYGTGETFHTTPDWKSTPRPDTRSVALADFDGDGYLDLA